MTQEREIELIERIVKGEKALYAEIVRRYQVGVSQLCYRLVGDRLETKEVTQRVFVELYTALPRFRFESRLSTFIYRITVNVVLDMLKQESRMMPLEQDWLPEEGHRNGEEQMERTEQERRLRRAIGMLHPEQRTALVLATFNDFTYNEVAEVMGITMSKVEALIYRAKQNLRNIMLKSEESNKENK
ncbi:MAG: RNA polymerase sigma factor [Bacteroidales bacterium]|nr:RNA polymerase sigma factor [Bacteroidales bacterium]